MISIKKYKKIFGIACMGFCLLSVFILPTVSLAQPEAASGANNNGYVLLAPLPGIGEGNTQVTLTEYIPGLFNLLIGLGIAFAVVNVFIGGFQYMSSDAFQKKQDGRQRIENAIKGLLLVAAAWLILYTINPNLLKFNLEIDTITTTQAGGTLNIPPTDSGNIMTAIQNSCDSCLVNLSLTYRLTAADLARLNCPTCEPMSPEFRTNNNTNTNLIPSLNNKLTSLNNGLKQQGVNWTVNEAFPPTVHHRDDCHFKGTCIDAGISNKDGATIKRFIETAKNNGLRAEYEVSTETRKQAVIKELQAAGMTVGPRTVLVVSGINNEHFSVYND